MGLPTGDPFGMAVRMTQRFLALLLVLVFAVWCIGSVVWGVPLAVAIALRGQPPGSYAIGAWGFIVLVADVVAGILAAVSFVVLGRRLPF